MASRKRVTFEEIEDTFKEIKAADKQKDWEAAHGMQDDLLVNILYTIEKDGAVLALEEVQKMAKRGGDIYRYGLNKSRWYV